MTLEKAFDSVILAKLWAVLRKISKRKNSSSDSTHMHVVKSKVEAGNDFD